MNRYRNIDRPILLPLCAAYYLAVQIRNLLFDLKILRSVRFRLPIISVGNITVGGTGKTPHVEYLVQLLKNDYRLAVLSRGYKRETNDFNLASTVSSIAEIGDEPLQIKQKFPETIVAVENNRVKGVRKLLELKNKPEVVILDDAFQHRHIKPGLNILLIDYNRPVFNDMLLPAGNLREPWRNMSRADLIIITKCPSHLSPCERSLFISKINPKPKQVVFFTTYTYGDPVPVFRNKHDHQEPVTYRHLRKKEAGILLVTGIANTGPLEKFLLKNLRIDNKLTFPDHHLYDRKDLLLIKNKLKSTGTGDNYILVTEKDAVRLRELDIQDRNLRKCFYYIPIEVKVLAKGEKPLIKRVYKFIKKSGNK